MSEETIAYQLHALAIAAAKIRSRLAVEDMDKPVAARTCSMLDEVAAWAQDEAGAPEMTPEEIKSLKREYNAALESGQALYKEVSRLCDLCNSLNDRIREAEGDDYDGIRILFGAGFEVDDE